MRYHKNPITVDAYQMTYPRRLESEKWPPWLQEAWNLVHNTVGALQFRPIKHAPGSMELVTLEGKMAIAWDDYIIRGIKGELYPCKPDIFTLTYTPINNSLDMSNLVRGVNLLSALDLDRFYNNLREQGLEELIPEGK